MPATKCTYFDLPALGEPVRLLLAYGGEDFEDNRVAIDSWAEIKSATPFGQLPVYEEDGRVANQTIAICRYLGKKYGLIGSSDWENLEIDAAVDTIRDFTLKIIDYQYEPSAKAKDQKKETLFSENIPFFLERLEKLAKDNKGHLAAKKLTWADFYFAGTLDYFSMMAQKDLTEGNPNLAAIKENVFKLPAVAKWYEEHPIDFKLVKNWLDTSGTPTDE